MSNYGPSDLYGLRINDLSSATPFTRLYRGDVAPENLIAECTVPSQTWDSENFVPGAKLRFRFPGVPEDGVKYTLSFGNIIGGCKKGEKSGFSTSQTNYSTKPLNIVFTGKSDVKQLLPKEWRGLAGQVDAVSKVEAVFPTPVSLTGNESAALSLNNNAVATATKISVSPTEPNVVVIEFDDVALIKDRFYLITLKEGSVADASDATLINGKVIRGVVGLSPFAFKFKNPEVEYDDNGFPKTLLLDIEPKEYHGYAITTISGYSENRPNGTVKYTSPEIRSIKNDASLGTVGVATYTPGTKCKIGVSSLTFSPDEEYYLYCPEKHLTILVNGSNRSDESFMLISDSKEIKFKAPGIEAGSNFPKIKLDGPVAVSEHHRNPELKSGEAALEHLDVLEIKCDYYKFSDSDTKEDNMISSKGLKGQLYEMTPEGDVLVKELTLGTAKRGTNGLYLYPVATVNVGEELYVGRKYKICIPENAYRPSSGAYRNWVQSESFTFIINGARVPSCSLEQCNYQEGDKIRKMSHAVFYMDCEVEPVEGKNVAATFKCDHSGVVDVNYGPIKILNVDGKSVLVADFIVCSDKTLINGGVMPVVGNEKYRYYNLILPAGIVQLKGFPEITNEEYKVNLEISEDAGVIYVEPEYVNLTVRVNDSFVNTLRTVKGEKATINLDLGPNWKITSLKKNGYTVLDQLKGTEYTTVPLNEDSEIEAVTEYAGEFMVEHTDGVFGIEGTQLKVYADGGRIVAEGLIPGQEVGVYSVNGMTVGTATAEKDTVSITVAPGETYIVIVDGHAAKLFVK